MNLEIQPDPHTTIVSSSVTLSPLTAADAYATAKDTALTIAAPGVLANDSGLPVPTAAVTSSTTTAGGTITLGATGGFTYTPATGFTGSDTFTYRGDQQYRAATARP